MAKTNRRKNLHHMVWPKRDYNGIRKVARALPCLQVMLDVEVHRILHDMYNFPKLLKIEDAAFLVEHHRSKACACYDQNGNINVSILDIHGRGELDDGRVE